MAYDGMYSDLSTRGSANEVLNLAIATKDQILVSAAGVQANANTVNQQALDITAIGVQVADDALQVDAQSIEVQNNATFVAQAISNVVLEDAPADGQTYSRRNNQWVTGSTVSDFYTADLYWDTVTYGPANTLFTVYPRVNLSRPILPSCFVRRDVAPAENLVLEMRSTDPTSTWVATATIPAGQFEGFFTSGTVEPLDAAWGIQVKPNPVPVNAPQGLAIHIQWEITPDVTLTALK